MTLLLIYIALALGFSFLCSVMEAVLLSVSPSYAAHTEKKHPVLGRKLRQLKDDVDRPLAAILSLNTIAHTVGATGAGAQAVAVFGEAWVGVISAVLTLLILVISEIIPKTLGAVYWRQLVPSVIRLLVPTMWLMWPLVQLSGGLTRLLSRGHKKKLVSREELGALAELGVKEGVVAEDESRVLGNLLRLGKLRAADIMTPRTVLVALEQDTTVAHVLEQHSPLRFSRIPVYNNDLDEVVGFVLKSEIYLCAAQGESSTTMKALLRPIAVVPRNLSLRQLFERLMADSAHLALVVDEYGGTAGLVTLEDLVETLLGLEIVDEADTVQDMQELAREQWRKRARALGLEADGEEAST